MNDAVIGWTLLIVASLFNSYASFIVKYRFNELGTMDLKSLKGIGAYLSQFVKSPLLVSAIITFLIAPISWFAALNHIDLSVAFPVQFSLHLLWVIFFSSMFLKEKMDWLKVVGTLSIFLSLYFLYRSSYGVV